MKDTTWEEQKESDALVKVFSGQWPHRRITLEYNGRSLGRVRMKPPETIPKQFHGWLELVERPYGDKPAEEILGWAWEKTVLRHFSDEGKRRFCAGLAQREAAAYLYGERIASSRTYSNEKGNKHFGITQHIFIFSREVVKPREAESTEEGTNEGILQDL